jgi:asparagine synthase (glutamine-hydrolysing)
VQPRFAFQHRLTDRTSTELAPLVSRSEKLDVEVLAATLLHQAPLSTAASFYRDIDARPAPDVWGPPDGDIAGGAPRERLRSVLLGAIARAIEGATRVAVLASGGIDSACLLALTLEASRARGVSVLAVALDFASDGDDRPHLRALEESLRCEVLRVPPEAGAAHLAPMRNGVDEAPFTWPFGPTQIALYEAARSRGADRILTGAGGDHVFDGDPRWLADEALRHPLATVTLARALRDFDRPRSPVLSWIVRPHLARALPRGWRRWNARRHAVGHEALPWAGPRALAMLDALKKRRLAMDLEPYARADVEAYFGDPNRRYISWNVHQEQIAGGLERRDPYFERSVAKLMAAFPASVVFDGHRRRGLLREAFRGRVPDVVLDRPDKADFGPAFARFFRAAGGLDAFAEERRGRALASLGLVDRARFEPAIARAFASAEENAAYGYAWGALAVEAFLLRHPERWS